MKHKHAEAPNPLATLRAEIERKNAERLAAMTPEERAEELDRIEEHERAEAEIDAATVPLREHWRLEEDYSHIIDELEEQIGDLSQMALDKLQAQETELKAARTRIDALIDANLKAQDIRRQLDRIEAQTAPSLTRAQIRDISRHFNTVKAGTTGYVLDFTDKTFDAFATDVVGHSIRRPGMSKWKSLDDYLMNEATTDEARTLLAALLDHEETTVGRSEETDRIRALIEASKTGKADAIEANLGAKLDRLQKTADRIETKTDETAKDVVETRQGVGVLVQHLPDAKKTPIISWAEAAEHFMPGVFLKRGDEYVRPAEERGKAVDSFRKTCSNWLKAGVAGRSGLPISRDNLATVGRWDKWIEVYRIAERKATIVSEHAGKVESEKERRRTPTA